MRIFAAAVAVSCFVIFPARAADVRIGAQTIKVPTPVGFCEMNDKQDKNIMDVVRGTIGTNQLLAQFGECKELARVRSGNARFLLSSVQFQTDPSIADQTFAAPSVEATCDDLRKNGEAIQADKLPSQAEAAKRLAGNSDFKMQFLGVLEETRGKVCYFALLQRNTFDKGEVVLVAKVSAVASIRDKLVFIYNSSQYENQSTIATSLANLKIVYSDLAAANSK